MVRAVEYVSRCCGGSQSHILRASNDRLYVTKFQDNPQGTKILAHEWIASQLAQALDFPVPAVAMLEVDGSFVERHPQLGAGSANVRWRYGSGIHFGSEWIPGVLDYIAPKSHLFNIDDYAGMFAFDRWTGQVDVRQAVFTRCDGGYFANFVDFGYAFMDASWPEGKYMGSCLHGLCSSRWVYDSIVDWNDFEPWLSAIERLSSRTVFGAIEDVPREWMLRLDCERIAEALLSRQGRLRDYLLPTINNPLAFPSWYAHIRDAA